MVWPLLKEEDKMKLLVSLNKKRIDDYLNYTNSFIIGLKEFSVNYLEFALEEIKELLGKYPHIELFISLNKNIFNKDLDKLEKVLIELSSLPISGLLFYDLSILAINERLGLNLPLGWHQGPMVTNYNTCEYYRHKGCKYAYLASEITEKEMIEIRNKTEIKLMALFLGYPLVSQSKRELLSNYFTFCHKKKTNNCYTITSGDSSEYFIKENNHETSILSGTILNGTKPLYNLKDFLDYAVLDEQMLDHQIFISILKKYVDIVNNQNVDIDKVNEEVRELIHSDDTGFFYKETIYKVRDEKKS